MPDKATKNNGIITEPMTQTDTIILSLIQFAVSGNWGGEKLHADNIDWTVIADLSSKQGIDIFILDSLQQYLSAHPSYKPFANETKAQKRIRMQWFGRTMTIEKNYSKHETVIADLARIYDQSGIDMMVLKGYGLSLNWPMPNHRPMGDLDIYNFGKYKDADNLISKHCNIKIDSRHEHHTTFRFKDILVENHYDFINVTAHRDAPAIEKRLKYLATTGYKEHKIQGTKIYLPSADFNAIFLMRHMAQHFAGTHLNLRQILDWGFFVRAHSQEVNWNDALDFLKGIGLIRFFNQINAICVDYLGFTENEFPKITREIELEKRILSDILHPEFADKKPTTCLLPILVFKFRRWWHNRWKHKIVYKDSLPITFLTLLYSHLIRIDTIKD